MSRHRPAVCGSVVSLLQPEMLGSRITTVRTFHHDTCRGQLLQLGVVDVDSSHRYAQRPSVTVNQDAPLLPALPRSVGLLTVESIQSGLCPWRNRRLAIPRPRCLVLQSQMTSLMTGGLQWPWNLASVFESPIVETKLIENPKVRSQCICDCSARLRGTETHNVSRQRPEVFMSRLRADDGAGHGTEAPAPFQAPAGARWKDFETVPNRVFALSLTRSTRRTE